MESEEQDCICMMVKMEGEAYSWAVREVEPRDLVTHWIWEMLQKKEYWFTPGVPIWTCGGRACPAEIELTEAGASLRGTESIFRNANFGCGNL